jgi:hypothetical protein
LTKYNTSEWVDEGAGGNLPMFKGVKKGDILLVPHLPTWGEVAIVEATADWNTGYYFDIDNDLEDYGHHFPARLLKSFIRSNEHVTGNIRTTLKCKTRFWNMNYLGEDIQKLLHTEDPALKTAQNNEDRFTGAIGSAFSAIYNADTFAETLYTEFNRQFQAAEWEDALVYGLSRLFPNYTVERVGGVSENAHGTDILIKIPGLLPDREYAIAVQVKDHIGSESDEVIRQINKADAYWNNEGLRLIEKVVIVTGAEKENNLHLLNNASDVTFIFAADLKQLLLKIGEGFAKTDILGN